MSDQLTVELNKDANTDEAPVVPVEVEDFTVEGVDPLGAFRVRNADHEDGGVWSLALDIRFAVTAIQAVTVDERLKTGMYVLVRVPEDDDAE